MNKLSRPTSWNPILGATLLVLLAACGQEVETPEPDQPSIMKKVALEDWDWQLQEYPPNILVVDYWATWCAPCIDRFPRMVEMSEQYAEQGVTLISYNLDEPQDDFAIARADEFLLSMEAGFEHFATADNVFDTMNYLGLQSIPAVSIYDRSGVEVTRLTGEDPGELFDDADVEQAILNILAEQPRLN